MKSMCSLLRVSAFSILSMLCGIVRADQALVRHAPVIGGTIDGSIQQMLAEGTTLNGGAIVTGDLLVPGSPTVRLNGHPNYAGTLDSTGGTSPTNYQVTLNGNASLRNVIRRTDAVTLPVVNAPSVPTGSVSLTITSVNQSVNWSSARNVILNGNVGQYAVPAGSYGDFTANGGSGFTLGIAGSNQPSVYNFQHLTLNGNTQFKVLGPVILNLANGFTSNGFVGTPGQPGWFMLNIQDGGLTLNGGAAFYGYVVAPNGTVIVNGNSLLVGGVISDRLTVNGNGTLRLQALATINQPPSISFTAPTAGSSFTAPASFVLAASATDPDGFVALVEFFEGTTKLGQSTTAPFTLALSAVGAGSHSYYLRAIDNLGASADSATLTVTVTNLNQPPSVSLVAPVDGAVFTAPATIALSASAADSDGTVSKVEFYQGSTKIGEDLTAPFSQSTSVLTAGTYEFSAKAFDNLGSTATSVKTVITVLNPNQPPAITITAPLDGASVDDPATFTLKANANDSDGTIAKVEFFQNGVRLGESMAAPYEYSINALPIGVYDFVVRATDNLGSSTDSTSVRITVAHVNDKPIATPQTLTILEDSQSTITLTGTDPDNDAITFSLTTQPSHGTLIPVTSSTFNYIPAPNFNGIDSFTFKASDGTLESVPSTIQINVTPRNDAPVAQFQSVTLAEDESAAILLTASDIDSASLTFVIQSGVSHGTLSGIAPNLIYIPEPNYHGTDSFTYSANDGALDSNFATVSLTITPVNDAPIANAQSLVVNGGSTLPITLTASDVDGDALSYSVVSNPSHGTLSGTTPLLTFTPAAGYSGTDSFTFKARDGSLDSLSTTVTINVQAPVAPPTAGAAQAEVQVGASVSFTLNGSDAQGLALAFSLVSSPALGSMQMVSVSGQSSQWTYTAGATVGVDKFIFTVSNGQLTSTPATVKVRVVPVPPSGDGVTGKAGGIVRDATTLEPLEGVIVHVRDISGAVLTDANGQYMIPVVQFGTETAKMIVLEYDVPGYITTYRRLIAYPDVPVTTEPVFLKKYDLKITTITSLGGMAVSAAGDVQANFPAGAVSGTLAVQLTNYSYGRELPGFLPKASAFTYAVDLSPNGATFASPVTVRIANTLGFAPNTPVPVGVFNPQTVRWEPESMGSISADGQWVVFQVMHFSARDGNQPTDPKPVDNNHPQPNPDDDSKEKKKDPGVTVAQGTYEADIDLTSYRSIGREHSIKLRYESEAAAGRRPFTTQATNGRNTASPLARAFNISIAGRNYQTTFAGEPSTEFGSYYGGAVLDLHDLPTGLYPYTYSVSNLYASTYFTATVFGGSPETDTGVMTREAIPYAATRNQWLPWVNASDSPFGAGWSLYGFSRLYFSAGSNQIMLTSGSADWMIFKRKVGLLASTNQVGSFNQSSLFSARKDYQGGLLIAHGNGISRMDVNQQFTPIVDGVSAMRYVNVGSGSTILMPGGIIDMAESESGTIYILAQIDQADTFSALQKTGLYRLLPNSTAFEAVAQDLITPVEVQLDSASRAYVYDASMLAIYRYSSSGKREEIANNIYNFRGMAYDEGANRVYVVSGSGLQYISGEGKLVNLTIDSDVPFINNMGRPVISQDGEVQIYGEGYDESNNYQYFVYRFTCDGKLVQRQPTDLQGPNQQWEETRLGKTWWLDSQGTGTGNPPPQLAAQAANAGTQSTLPAYLTELKKIDGAQDVYRQRGERLIELTKTTDGWVKDAGLGEISHYSTTGLLLDTKDRNGNAFTYSYDSQNRLLKIVDPVGAATTFTYAGNGKLAQIQDPAGRRTTFQMDSQGNLTAVKFPDGAQHAYAYDADHHIVKKTDALARDWAFSVSGQGVYSSIALPDSTSVSFVAQRPKALAVADLVPGVNRGYDDGLPARVSAGKPDKIIDANGNQSEHTLDERGFPIVETDGLGNSTSIQRDNRDRILSRTDVMRETTYYSYDELGNPVAVQDPMGGVTSFTYDPVLNLPLSITDARGNLSSLEYDSAGNLVKNTDPLGNVITFTYNTRGQILAKTNALGQTTRWSYDSSGNPQTVADPSGQIITYQTNSAGQVIKATDPLGNSTVYTRDACNRIISIVMADGATTNYTYNSNGNRVTATDALGRVTRFWYDSMDRLVRTTLSNGSETRTVYDAVGNRVQTIDAADNITRYTYDIANRLIGIIDAAGGTTSFALNANGSVASVADPLGNTVYKNYDALGRVVKETDPLAGEMTFEYDLNGNRTKITDPLGRVTQTEYDALNRPIMTIAPDGGVTTFVYDAVGNIVTVTDPLGHVTTSEYDALNRAVKTTDSLNRTRLASYDVAGRVSTRTNGRGQVIAYSYDSVGHPTSIDLAGADSIAFTYDVLGDPLRVSNQYGNIDTTYDAMSRPATIRQPYGTVSYTYDNAGRRTQMVGTAGPVNYVYDALSRLAGITDHLGRAYSFAFDQSGNLARVNCPNNTYTTMVHDAAGQLTDKVHYNSSGSIIGDNAYGYNASGNITAWGSSDGNLRTFAYDPNDRVTLAQSTLASVGTENFAYDKVGNWTPYGGRLHNAANEITEDSNYIYSYDLDGNLIQKTSKLDLSDVTTYAWDPLNRLIQVNKGTHVVNYRYDGLGSRIAKVVDGVETRYVFDGSNVLEERNGSNALTAFNLYAGIDQLLMRQDYATGNTYWAHTDHLGSVEALTDASGNVVERYRYSSFGQLSVLSPNYSLLTTAPKVPFTYTSREWEPEVGMYFYRARFMDPRMGRFISKDPIGFAAGDLNILAYVGNNPIGAVDPTGLEQMASFSLGSFSFGDFGFSMPRSRRMSPAAMRGMRLARAARAAAASEGSDPTQRGTGKIVVDPNSSSKFKEKVDQLVKRLVDASPEVAQAINNIIDSGHTVTIAEGTDPRGNDNGVVPSRAYSQDNPGDSTIRLNVSTAAVYDSYVKAGIMNTDDALAVNLAHELGHAEGFATGTQPLAPRFDEDELVRTTNPPWEEHSMELEHAAWKGLGLPSGLVRDIYSQIPIAPSNSAYSKLKK